MVVGEFMNIKDFGAKGDGVTDDTAAFEIALYRIGRLGTPIFIDAGSYILTRTITVYPGNKLIGEAWPQLVASGPFFEDANNPKPLIKVGNVGDVGNVELQDLIFTNKGPTAGLIFVEWNINAQSPGSAALWGKTSILAPEVSFAMAGTSGVSSYTDLVSSDPDLEDANNTMVQTSIYVARGLLVESQVPVWLYGTSSEHAVFYQYNFHNARNIFAGMIQTESPYYQPTPPPPAPFQQAVGAIVGDPDYTKCGTNNEFNGCDESWGVIIRRSSNIFIAGAGIYSWFSTYGQDCIDEHACQKALVLLEDNYINVRIHHLITIGAKYMVVQDGIGIPALDNLNVESHPRWSQISVFDASFAGPDFDDILWLDPVVWDTDESSFTCSPPCTIKVPPWTLAASVVDFPRVTVSDGTWTSTITRPPMTISQWVFEVVTLEAGEGKLQARQGFDEFWPKPATTSHWPAVQYMGPDGKKTTTTPSDPFPTPPSSIGPNAPDPPKGRWPRSPLRPIKGVMDVPFVGKCSFHDPGCYTNPLMYGPAPDAPEDPYDEEGSDESVSCPGGGEEDRNVIKNAEESPRPRLIHLIDREHLDHGDPSKNEKTCFHQGRWTTHVKLDNAINSFCKSLGRDGAVLVAKDSREREYRMDYDPADPLPLKIAVSVNIKEGCEKWNFDECSKYLHVPVDSCNCAGVDMKQGGWVSNNCYSWTIDPNTKE